ncbi:hypothetical protein CPB83DRAFT_880819 [Crepidotus variabilis]|uniref:F-box domain-containing protein n=1 Tax=Crepidotus variabilis TaxID=179855 RepID=A0A9P6ENH5_9AGAR|nr:hypothetical protein CPB83DRAFT_880819 [Crepidotus variabilis]
MERRMSARIKGTAVATPQIDSRPKKKQRTTKAATISAGAPLRGRKGSRLAGKGHSAEYFSELPTELLLEIFGFLEPADVLHLYRASKYFHEFLGFGAANYLWEQVYTNMTTPPPIPVGVNIRYFTNFLYGRHCNLVEVFLYLLTISLALPPMQPWYMMVATQIQNWKIEQERILAREEEKKRQNRFNSAKTRLTAEGYERLLWSNQSTLQYMPSIRNLRELDDDEWNNIRVDVINELQAHSDLQSESLKQTSFINGVKSLEDSICKILSPAPDYLPAAWLIAQKEPFRNKIKHSYSYHGFTSEDFKPFKKSLKAVIEAWKSGTDAYLLEMVPRTKGKGSTALALATSFFSCHWCSEPVGYPRILVHYCEGRRKNDEKRKRNNVPKLNDFRWSDEDEESADEDSSRHPHPHKLITKDTVWDKMPNLFRAAKKHPDEITFEDFNQKDIRIQCVGCSNRLKGKPLSRLVMTWTKAIMHHLQHHSGEEPSESDWNLVDSKDALLKAKEAEAKAKVQPQMCCIHCGMKKEETSFGNHIRQDHNIKVAEKKIVTHYREPFDISMKGPPHAVRI